jgi:succinate-semialdehyde dehydrogenase/glutarate-semialdehyde dehydrogenase
MAYASIDPTTGRRGESFPEHTEAEIAERVARAERAFADWRDAPHATRARALRAIAVRLRERARELAVLAAEEMGKPLRQGRAEVEKCAVGCEHYAEHGAAMLAPEAIATDAARSAVRFEPLGVVLAIMPWNFPYWQVVRAAAPALTAGNAILLKHAPNVPRCAQAIEMLCLEAGLPAGCLQSLRLSNEAAGALIAHPAVRGVTLTGSTRAGREVAERAGRALKRCVLELGGSDPFVVLADADVAAVARQACVARTQNAGQSCIAAKRFLVPEAIADAFVAHLRAALEALRVGDPRDEATDVGPLAREDLVAALDEQVRGTLAAGATCVTGGRRLPGPGFFYGPTLLDHVRPGMPAAEEETFGPVAAVIRVRDEDEAVSIANASRYGLGASVWGRDLARAEALAARIEAGSVFVNGVVKSDPRLPFGGVKDSGFGRELGVFGIREFVNVKTVWVGGPR